MPLFYTGAEGAVGMGSMLLPLILMLALMYFLMIRPESKRKKQAEEMRNSLKKGDQITTIGGIMGKIVHVGEDSIVIETSDDRVRMELTKWAVSSVGVQSTEQPEETKEEKKPAKKEEKKDEEKKEGESWNPEL